MKKNLTHVLLKEIPRIFNIQFENISKSPTGFSDEVFRGSLEGKTVYIRISNDPRGLAPEVHAYELAQSVGVPTPQVVRHLKKTGFPYEVVVLSEVEGIALHKAAALVKNDLGLYRNLGKMLKKIHTIPLRGYGRLLKRHGAYTGEYTSWKTFIANKKSDYKELLEKSVVTENQYRTITQAFAKVTAKEPAPVFIHNDFHESHIFVKNGSIAGIIDFSRAGSGDPRYDIAIFLYSIMRKRCFQELAEQFKKGYGAFARDKIIDQYILVIATRKAIWTLENTLEAKTHCIRHLKGVLKKLG